MRRSAPRRRFAAVAPRALFAASLVLAVFGAGVWVGKFQVFPHDPLRDAWKTLRALHAAHSRRPYHKRHWILHPEVLRDRPPAARIQFIEGEALADPVLLPGGWGKFTEHCPNAVGCIAVEYAGRGALRHAWPYRPEAIASAPPRLDDAAYEQALGFSFPDDADVAALRRYPNGDLLVVFHFEHSFPSAGGVARLDSDGLPLWYRRDYSHHRPHFISRGGETALVPGLRIGDGPITWRPAERPSRHVTLQCETPIRDLVREIDGSGRVLREVPVLDALLESRYAPILQSAPPCDPIHLNSIHELGEDAGGADGLAPGDLVASLRNLSAFAVLDRRTHRVKRLVRGSFFQQHDVLHLGGSRFLLFDNHGESADGFGPSRLLVVDVADGDETTVFPNAATPDHLREAFFTLRKGSIFLSPDRRRAIATATWLAVEVRLADGAVLTVFNAVHDVAPEAFPGANHHRLLTRTAGVSYR